MAAPPVEARLHPHYRLDPLNWLAHAAMLALGGPRSRRPGH
jgi:hypothetical protein